MLAVTMSAATASATTPPGAATPPALDSAQLQQYVDGNLAFVAFHEMGHALVSELDIPIAGREEDAVDRLATLILMPDQGDPPTDLMAAMDGWFRSDAGQPVDSIPWWDEHGTGAQRGFQIACLLYGADPTRFAAAADAGLPEERRQSCVDEAQRNDKAWTRLLAGGLRPAGSPPGDPIPVTYEDTTDYATEQAYLMGSGILEAVSSALGQWNLKPGIAIRAAECKEINAFWDPDGRVLTMCYELVRDYLQIATGTARTG